MLQLNLLGNVKVLKDGHPVKFRSQTEKALLIYLAHTGGMHRRETIADLLWEARSTRQSLSNLRTAITRLRRRVGDALIVTRKTLMLAPGVSAQTDSAELNVHLDQIDTVETHAEAAQLQETLQLYKGDFLDGFYLRDAPRFNEWVVFEQEYLRQKLFASYGKLLHYAAERKLLPLGIETARAWLRWDPLNEVTHRKLLRLLAANNQTGVAAAEHQQFVTLLDAELGMTPQPATTELVAAIERGEIAVRTQQPTVAHNLPRRLKPFFGRNQAITTLTQTLLTRTYPLVTITGIGGVGKTSLALAVGRELLSKANNPFRDGIWLISLADIEEVADDFAATKQAIENEVATMIGATLGLTFHSQSDPWSQLLGQLASRQLLLILDNVEHFRPIASDLILALLQAGDGISLLVTSRTSLALASNHAFLLDGLEVPDRISADNPSVQLFAECATQAPASLNLATDLRHVVDICRYVQGVPLAIELAAAALGRLMIDEIMPALTSSTQLLDVARPDLPAHQRPSSRHRTLRAVFETSWRLLAPAEQQLLAQISVFRGGFTRAAASAVLDGGEHGLYYLQHHALLKRTPTGRYTLHPLVRQLANEKLRQIEDVSVAEQVQQRHSAYFSDFVAAFEGALRRGTGQAALASLASEQANIHAAWHFAVASQQWRLVGQSLGALGYWFERKAAFVEALAYVDGAIEALEQSTAMCNRETQCLLGRLLVGRAQNLPFQNNFEAATQSAERALAIATTLSDPQLGASAEVAQAVILHRQNHNGDALEHYRRALALAQRSDDLFLTADALLGIGARLLRLSDFRLAQQPLTEAHGLCLELAYKRGELEALHYLGGVAHLAEDNATFLAYTEQFLTLARELDHLQGMAEGLGSMGVSLKAQGELYRSIAYQEEALEKFQQLNMRESVQWLQGELGHTAFHLGDYVAAETRYTAAIDIARQLDDVFFQAWWGLQLGMLRHQQNDLMAAWRLVDRAKQVGEQFDHSMLKMRVLNSSADLLWSMGDVEQAKANFQAYVAASRELGQIEQALPAIAGLALMALRCDARTAAETYAQEVWEALQQTPDSAERADLNLYWRLGTVFDELGDGRAPAIWQQANDQLHARSQRIPDVDMRAKYLHGIKIHQLIQAHSAVAP